MLTYQNETIVYVPASLVETNVPTKVVGTTTKRNFTFQQVVGTVVPTMIVVTAVPTIIVTAVPTIIVLTAYYWKSCVQSRVLDCVKQNIQIRTKDLP